MYKRKTEFFGIPIPCKDDFIEEDEEAKRMNIIENQLLASTKGIRCAVFEEGHFRIIDNNDGTCSVNLFPAGGNYAICGMVNGGYIESKEAITWENISKGGFYYLYISFTSDTYENENAFRLIVTTISKTNQEAFLLMATLDLRNGKEELNSIPDTKLYGCDLASHVNDKTNPHGEHLYQNELTVTKGMEISVDDESIDTAALTIDDKRSSKATIESKNEMILKDKRATLALSDDANTSLLTENQTVIGAINEAFQQKIYVVDMDSGGKGGILITVPNANEIISAEVHQIAQISKGASIFEFSNLGEIAIGYLGIDGNVTDKGSLKVYNNGSTGIKIRVRIFYR